ncbi:hypothetical protein [Streptomyces sp. NEAU-W12]|uniref:hypothetical protein n=1 Tax=Streptomyces sp. NEAU-W12 TaxID=2994668 RepID=UPI00224B5B80|nr:hypothetical protein [Streptomyces sp. NEAU-W12]MCX2927170.1 hypothetical protein [Streptomyces sp. NEAU-W12]
MGERRNDGGTPGRRRAHPDEGTSQGRRTAGPDRPGSGSASVSSVPASARHPARDAVTPDALGLEVLLADALVQDVVDAGAEQRAVAAFREARDAATHSTRTRRRDDWRPREQRLGRLSVKATLSVLIAGLGLGGVAVAGIGAAGPSAGPRDGGGRPTAPVDTSAVSEAPSADRPSAADADADADPGSGPAATESPLLPRETEAHCRAYEKLEGRGRALDSTAWKRLVGAAGGAANIDAYCAGQVGPATREAEPAGTGEPKDRTGGAGGTGSGPSSGAGNSGNDTGGPGNGASGRQGASARPGGEKKP